MKKSKIIFKLCVVSLAATILLSGGIAEISGFVWEGIGSVAVSAAGAETPASSFEYVENDDGDITITRFIGNETEVVIPSEIDGKRVTKIGKFYSLSYCEDVVTITIPKSVTEIDRGIFSGLKGLQSILVDEENELYSSKDGVLFSKDETELICYPASRIGNIYTVPDSVKIITSYAFSNSKLTKINIGENVRDIGEWEYGNFEVSVFDGCKELQEINLSPNNEYYSSQNGVLFNEEKTVLLVCPIQKQGIYEIPSTVMEIDGRAFENCYNLTNIILPEDLEKIGYSAFGNCKQLTSIDIPKNVEFGGYAKEIFESCESLIAINVDINNQLYSSCEGIVLNKDQTELLCCPAGKTNCLLPDTVTEIGYGVLYGKLRTITLPKGFIEFDRSAFMYADNLTEILIDEENPNYTSVDGVVFDKEQTKLIYCPRGKMGKYTVPNGITSIEDDAFDHCSGLTSISISHSVSNIGYVVFVGCNSLLDVNVDANNANYCSVDGVLFNKDMTEILCYPGGRTATSYRIPNGAENIVYPAFYNYENLTTIIVPNSVAGELSLGFVGDTKAENLTIVGVKGSSAEQYAEHYGFRFIELNEVSGDTNGDGVADIADSLMISRYDAGLITLDDAKVAVSDVNNDGSADIADALKIARFDAGLINSLS